MNIQDLLKLSPEELIAKVEAGDVSDCIVYTIPLDNALNNFQVEIAGNYIACISGFTTSGGATDSSVNATLEFNRIGNGQVNFTQGLGMIRPFSRFFLTASAQAGKSISFIISSYAPLFGIQDNRSNSLQTTYLSNIQAELQGPTAAGTFGNDATVGTTPVVSALAANANRHAFIIQADLTNTGTIYLGFDNTVSSTKKICSLTPGQSFLLDDYRGPVFAVASAAGQKISASEY